MELRGETYLIYNILQFREGVQIAKARNLEMKRQWWGVRNRDYRKEHEKDSLIQR